MLKVQGGTPNHSRPSLCRTCRHACVVQGHAHSEELIACSSLAYGDGRKLVPFPVASCSEYDDKSSASLWEMKKIAWTLRTDGGARQIGFVSPSDLERERREAATAKIPEKVPDDPDEKPLWDPLKREEVY